MIAMMQTTLGNLCHFLSLRDILIEYWVISLRRSICKQQAVWIIANYFAIFIAEAAVQSSTEGDLNYTCPNKGDLLK